MNELPRQSGANGNVTVNFLNDVAVLQIKRGENRINLDFLDQVNEGLDQVEKNVKAKALVTTGDGKFYCNGLDLELLTAARYRDPSNEFASTFRRRWMASLKRIITFPMPTIAAINGHAYGGGANLAMAHDYRLMRADRGWFCISEVHLGIPLSAMTRQMLRLKIQPSHNFSDVVVLGRRLTGPEAKKMGVVSSLSPADRLIPDAIALANRCLPKSGIPRYNMSQMKTNVYENVLQGTDDDIASVPGAASATSKL